MSFGLAGKISIGIVGAIGTLATGAGIYQLTKGPSTLGELLERNENLKLLNNENEKWSKLIEEYKKQDNKPLKIKEFSFGAETKSEEENKKALQDACQKLWNTKLSEISNEDLDRKKEEAKTWCIINPKALN